MNAPPLDAVGVTLRDFVSRAGAMRAVALLDRGEAGAPVVVDCDAAGGVEVEEAGEIRVLPAVSGAAPLVVPHVHPLPAMDVDPASGQVTGIIGGLQHLADAVGE